VLCRDLQQLGYDVKAAGGVEEGVRLARSERPDVVVFDATEPGTDAAECCRRLQRSSITRVAPVIVIAAEDEDLEALNATGDLDPGAFDYVQKPYDKELLAARIRAALRVKDGIDAMHQVDNVLHEEHLARIKAERLLTEKEATFRTVASAAQDAIIMLDPEGNVSFWNRAAERIFGYSSEEVLGKNVHELLCRPRELAAYRAAFPHFQRTGQGPAIGKVIQVVALRKDGSEVPVELSLAAVRIDGRWRAVGVVRDITERRKADTALRKAHDDLELIFNAASPMAVIGLDKQVLRVNDAAAELLHLPKEQIVGQRCSDLMPCSTCNTDRCGLEVAARGESAELAMQKSCGGRTLDLLVRLHPYRDADGRIIGCVQSLTDITRLKQVERELRKSELKYRTLFESSRDAIMTLTPEGRFLSANPATVRLFGCRDEQHFASFGPAELSPEYQPDGRRSDQKAAEMIATALRNGSHFFEWRHKRVDGTEFDATVLLTRMELDGQVLLQATVRDISEQKRREAELARLNKELIEASRQAGMAEVATCVLHNVGNVLNSINVAAESIRQRLQASRVEAVSAVARLLEEQGDRLADFLTNDRRGRQLPAYLKALGEHLQQERDRSLEELAQLRQDIEHVNQIVEMQQSYGRAGGVQQLVQLDELLDQALQLSRASFLRHSVEIVRDYEKLPPVTIDKHRLLQIVVNLIANAKDALLAANRQDRRIVLRIRRAHENMAAIEVEDNGVGIEPENLRRIFEFGFTTKKNGHGFGLHMSALAAKELGGTLEAHSDGPGSGARFTLTIPLNVTEQQLDQLTACMA